MTARRSTTGAAAVRALRRTARTWLRAYRAAHQEMPGLWRYGPGLGPTAPLPARPDARGAAPRGAAPGEARPR